MEKKQSGVVNVRRGDVMTAVSAAIEHHYQSPLIDSLRALGGHVKMDHLEIVLAEQFGFCNGVRRAIDIAYAARRVFPDARMFLIGEIIHNPEVNRQLDQMGIQRLPWKQMDESYETLGLGDVVIIPAFGVPTAFRAELERRGVSIVDTTCGDVMKVWRRVKTYAQQGITSIIHGKVNHEESLATASYAQGTDQKAHYVIVFTSQDCQMLCDYLLGKATEREFMMYFKGAKSAGFKPELFLKRIGLANQTTMLKGDTQQIQAMLRAAIIERDGDDKNFFAFDTICGATQDRQDALFKLLESDLDLMIVVGGYNSSNTTHLVEIAERKLPTLFIESADCLESLEFVRSYSVPEGKEIRRPTPACFADLKQDLRIGITAGASCPANLIAAAIRRLAELREEQLPEALRGLE